MIYYRLANKRSYNIQEANLMEKSVEKNLDQTIPEDVKGWNWGAFFLNGIWGIFNKTYIALLAFIPIINIPVMFFLGYKGNKLSWNNNEWTSVEHFQSTQRKWNVAGFVAFLIYCIIILVEFWDTLS